MKQSDTIKQFAAAFVAAQAKIIGAVKDKTNPHFHSKYADLASVADACKGPLNECGIAFIQTPEPDISNSTLTLTTRLIHTSGEWIEGAICVPVPKQDPQAYGSALTYARRYGLSSITGVCPEDDDAEAATHNQPPEPVANTAPKATPINDAEAFQVKVRDAFEARNFTDDQWRAANVYICNAKKITSVDKLDAKGRASLMAAIADGKFDKFKEDKKAA